MCMAQPEETLLRARSVADITPRVRNISPSPIGDGHENSVWTAQYNGAKVAVIATPGPLVTISKRKVESIIRALQTWTQLKHSNIVALFGICDYGKYSFALVLAWMAHGTIVNYLQMAPHADRPSLASDILAGLQYLHSASPSLVHGDLRGGSIFVDESGRACIGNFPLYHPEFDDTPADMLESEDEQARYHDVVRWHSPERLESTRFGLSRAESLSPAADMYSFGMVIYELCTGRIPFSSVQSRQAMVAVHTGQRPSRDGWKNGDEIISDMMWGIAQECWQEDWRKRTTATPLATRLAQVVTG